MKNKCLIMVIIISFCFIFFAIFMNFFMNNIYVNNFEEYERVEVFSDYKNKKISACYGNKFICNEIMYKIKGSVNTNKVGVYDVTYEMNHNKKQLSKIKKVEVVDSEKPKLKVSGSFINMCPNGKSDSITISASDNYDGDLTDKIKYNIENNKITYMVTDSSDNTLKEEYKIESMDSEKPKLILSGDSIIYLSANSKYEEPGYVSIDNCDGDITKDVKVTGSVNTKKEGTYELKYTSKDKAGNEVSLNRTVKVFPKNNYNPNNISNKTIYLTFDDGPGPYTEKLLDILKKYDAKATFFVIGYNNNYNHLLTRTHKEGHTVALHSNTHRYDIIYSSVEAYMDDLLKIQSKVKEYTGVESRIIRFPGGSSNTISRQYRPMIMSELTKKVEELGFRYFDWTISSGDAGNTTNPNKVYENVINNIGENKANVVLLHDIKSYTVDAMERVIQYGLSNGYTFAPLTLESPVVHQNVNN